MAYTPFNTNVGKSSQPGRPAFINRLTVLRTPDNSSGFEFAGNAQPEVMQQVTQKYMRAGQMPDALRPKVMSSAHPLEQRRRRAISKGFVDPRGAT